MESASSLIQTMLSPGLMISACGLLILGMNNKYSLVVNRIRLLKDEKRRMQYGKGEDESRHTSIDLQVKKLFYRIALIRNAVFAYSVAVAFFILASVFIGINQQSVGKYNGLVIISFLAGTVFVFAGVLFAAVEVWRGYRIVKIEVEDLS